MALNRQTKRPSNSALWNPGLLFKTLSPFRIFEAFFDSEGRCRAISRYIGTQGFWTKGLSLAISGWLWQLSHSDHLVFLDMLLPLNKECRLCVYIYICTYRERQRETGTQNNTVTWEECVKKESWEFSMPSMSLPQKLEGHWHTVTLPRPCTIRRTRKERDKVMGCRDMGLWWGKREF